MKKNIQTAKTETENQSFQLDLDMFFKQRKDSFYNRNIRVYKNLMEKANDKEFAMKEFMKGVEGRNKFLIEIDDYKKELITWFDRNYKLGKSINETLKQAKNIQERYLEGDVWITDKAGNEIGSGRRKYDKKFFNNNDNKTLVDFFAKYVATNELMIFLVSSN